MPSPGYRENGDWGDGEKKKKLSFRSFLIILTLHLLLWFSLAAIAAGVLMLRDPADSTVTGSAIIVLVAASTSIFYILLHTYFSIRRRLGKSDDPATTSTLQQPVYIGIRICGFVSLLWLICSGWAIIVTVKSPVCNLKAGGEILVSCSCQKAGAALSVISLIASFVLFTLVQSTENPFDNSLFGRVTFKPAFKENAPNSSGGYMTPVDRAIRNIPSQASLRDQYTPSPTQSLYKGKQSSIPISQLAQSGIAVPGSGYFVNRSNTTLVDPHHVLQSASASSLSLARSSPVRQISSASNLMKPNPSSRIGYHYGHNRILSASSIYSSRPSSRASSFTELPAYVAAASPITVPAPSAWKAIHPPTHYLNRSPSSSSLRSSNSGSSSSGSLAMIHQAGLYGQRAKTAPSSSTSSRGSPQAVSWAHYKQHKRGTSSQSSSSSGSSRLGVVEEDKRWSVRRGPIDDDITPAEEPVPFGAGNEKKKTPARYHLPASPLPARNLSSGSSSSSYSASSSKAKEPPARYHRGLPARPNVGTSTEIYTRKQRKPNSPNNM